MRQKTRSRPHQDPQAESEARRRRHFFAAIWITTVCFLVSLTLTFLFYNGMEAPSFFANISANILVWTLFNVDLILGVLLLLLLFRNLIKLYFERRQRLMGSGFRTKLVLAFFGFTLIPAILLSFAASGYLTDSINNWFSIQVERPVNNALEIARSYYEERQDAVLHFGQLLGASLASEGLMQQSDSVLKDALKKKVEAYHLERVAVYGLDLKQRASAMDPQSPGASAVHAPEDFLKRALQGEEIKTAALPEEGRLIRGIFPIRASPASSEILGAIVVEASIPEPLVARMEEIKQSFEDYQQLKSFKNPIKISYVVFFLSITLVILFSATWFGFYLAKGITVPITKLAEGTQAVAQGNLDFRIEVKANDEIGMLVDSFNMMTADLKTGKTQLEEANRSLSRSNIEINRRRAYMETILEHIATGVIALDAQGRITNCNSSAEQILGFTAEEILDKNARDAFQSRQLDPFMTLLDKFKRSGKDDLEEEIHLEVMKKPLTLRFNLSALRDPEGQSLGVVMVFEDLSELLKAQKVAAWQEVAQRIAHEIKNPLTPIQLSTERLRKKFFEHSQDFDEIFDEATGTIIAEVNSLKTLVDEFSNFARFPSPRPSPQNLHEILNEVIRLYKTAHRDVVFETRYVQDPPILMLDREQWKRAFVNIFENAIEAMNGGGRLVISTLYDPKRHRVRLEIADNGAGIDPADFDKLFLPYFSRKKSGTGLGLAIVNRIVHDHNGQIRITSNVPQGATVIIELPVTQT